MKHSINTRFLPTSNGQLHIGHLYMAKLNECLAHSTDGEFTLRIDDDQPVWVVRLGAEQMHANAMQQVADIEWAGIQVDHVVFQSDYTDRVRSELAHSRFMVCADPPPRAHTFTLPKVHPAQIDAFPLSSQLVAEKVVLDRWWEMDACVRGIELLQEHQFYMYLCSILGYPWPTMYYYPRLIFKGISTINISKTIGDWQISNFQSRTTPECMWEVLREACLIDPQDTWSLDNVKDQPAIEARSIDDVLG